MFNPVLPTESSWTAYPEKTFPHLGWCDRQSDRVTGLFIRAWKRRFNRQEQFMKAVREQGTTFSGIGTERIRDVTQDIRQQLREHGFLPELLAKAFALIREVSKVTLGQPHYDVQMMGGRVLLEGMVAQMETGEGKTLTATLPACTAALAGLPVHVITVNDYLAVRDAKWMSPIYEAMGLRVGVIQQGLTPDARRAAYGCDVTYCTNKELAFDYLKDRIVLGRLPNRIQLQIERLAEGGSRQERLLLRGLHFGIVDEADSVLIDEARTPLIISGPARDRTEQQVYEQALTLAGQLNPELDFVINERERTVKLTHEGARHLEEIGQVRGGVWKSRQRREEFVQQALSAQYLFHRDRHYLIKEGKIQIVDEFTGRIMKDRSWERGLHQMIEMKENCELGARQDPLARITYQRFFRRYLRLAGMTGTASEVAKELWAVYRLSVVSIATNRPVKRKAFSPRIYRSEQDKWNAVLERVQALHQQQRPVLVGTRSVQASEHLSRMLAHASLPHRVLNARQDEVEAQIIQEAGQASQITVATNMAGRGTDIHLGPGVRELGGLHVIGTEVQEARRIDRQLFGRCGRQGDPGSYQVIASLEDELMQVYGPGLVRWSIIRWRGTSEGFLRIFGRLCFWSAQRSAERHHSKIRRDVLKADENLETTLAFAGSLE